MQKKGLLFKLYDKVFQIGLFDEINRRGSKRLMT
jgi:hypothetical protein